MNYGCLTYVILFFQSTTAYDDANEWMKKKENGMIHCDISVYLCIYPFICLFCLIRSS